MSVANNAATKIGTKIQFFGDFPKNCTGFTKASV